MQFRLFNHHVTIHVELVTGFSGWSMRRKRQFAQRADTIRLNKANQVAPLTGSFAPYANAFIHRLKEVRTLALAEGVFAGDVKSFYPCKQFVEEMFADKGHGNIVGTHRVLRLTWPVEMNTHGPHRAACCRKGGPV